MHFQEPEGGDPPQAGVLSLKTAVCFYGTKTVTEFWHWGGKKYEIEKQTLLATNCFGEQDVCPQTLIALIFLTEPPQVS